MQSAVLFFKDVPIERLINLEVSHTTDYLNSPLNKQFNLHKETVVYDFINQSDFNGSIPFSYPMYIVDFLCLFIANTCDGIAIPDITDLQGKASYNMAMIYGNEQYELPVLSTFYPSYESTNDYIIQSSFIPLENTVVNSIVHNGNTYNFNYDDFSADLVSPNNHINSTMYTINPSDVQHKKIVDLVSVTNPITLTELHKDLVDDILWLKENKNESVNRSLLDIHFSRDIYSNNDHIYDLRHSNPVSTNDVQFNRKTDYLENTLQELNSKLTSGREIPIDVKDIIFKKFGRQPIQVLNDRPTIRLNLESINKLLEDNFILEL
jgi:hypothetical protein